MEDGGTVDGGLWTGRNDGAFGERRPTGRLRRHAGAGSEEPAVIEAPEVEDALEDQLAPWVGAGVDLAAHGHSWPEEAAFVFHFDDGLEGALYGDFTPLVIGIGQDIAAVAL